MTDMTITTVQDQITTIAMTLLLSPSHRFSATDTPRSTDVSVEATSRDGRTKPELNVNKSVTELKDVKDLSSLSLVARDQ